MRKGIKILGKVLSTIALLLIFLPIATTLVLNVEPVQNAVVRRAAHYASAHLGTDVYIDGIDFDLFSKVRIRGLYVEDYNNDTLLYVTHASTSIDNLNISKDGLKLPPLFTQHYRVAFEVVRNSQIYFSGNSPISPRITTDAQPMPNIAGV